MYETFFSTDNNSDINREGIMLKEETLQEKSDKRRKIALYIYIYIYSQERDTNENGKMEKKKR